ncbi:hypothetical protein FJT64_008665 [Amphibalanus amphitrite]|uniref:Uncharacterized protein n=2 Tax=Amphibalanus amphitrite TaxID=1232801 RepID=A0A6A4VUK1_AMPAM|nr:hypothetical protein FJT64_008665 [Amphibalanus amphitrite]
MVECHVEGASALAETSLPDLRRLNLSGEMYIDWVAVELALSRWPRLERLDLAESSVPAELVRELPDLVPGLTYLDLSGCNVTPWSVASLHRLKNLRHLKLTDVRLINVQWSAVVRDATELVESLQRITSLRELSLGETPRRRGPLQMSFNAAAVEW